MWAPKNVMKNAEHLELSFLTKHLLPWLANIWKCHMWSQKRWNFLLRLLLPRRCRCPIDDFLPKKLLPARKCYFPNETELSRDLSSQIGLWSLERQKTCQAIHFTTCFCAHYLGNKYPHTDFHILRIDSWQKSSRNDDPIISPILTFAARKLTFLKAL